MQKDILQWNKQTSFRSKIHGLKLLVFWVLMQCNEILKKFTHDDQIGFIQEIQA